ncbi:ParA family protein [Aliiglaciecola lipolytica]|uniref:Chromosome partitioning protein n=1 Tax=Aliiglaciecola lipolytica E3 TaxID=1127673 RepID=K6YGY6_9ALTE|nr:ParA family protein [Aliiglaciecola lipolytica]GAC15868.1 chromosome partitioning protein [Aliiglaciecola lipolytica E3]
MVVWAIANQKGGVGKTTTTVTLGGILAQQGNRVLLVDTDPQASLSYYFGVDAEELSHSVFDVFTAGDSLDKDKVLDSLCSTKLDSLFILPSSMALATLDRTMGTQPGMGLILKKAFAKIADEFDYVLIDCPPVLGVLMVNAVAACDKLLVPVQTEFLALKGLQRMMHTLEIMSKSQKRDFDYIIVPTLFDKRVNAATEAYRNLCETYKGKVWSGVIPVDTRFRDASQAQSPPSVFSPKARGVYAYKNLLTQLQTKVGHVS